jgi:hypothetical protein
MSAVKWLNSTRSGNPISVLTTELNSLASTGSAITASAIDNDTDHDMYADFELVITYGSAPTAGSLIELYVVRTVDGTNFEDGSTTGPVVPASGFAGAFVLRAVTTAQRMIVPGVAIPPRDFHVMVVAKTTGQTAAASGNTLKALFYGEQIV